MEPQLKTLFPSSIRQHKRTKRAYALAPEIQGAIARYVQSLQGYSQQTIRTHNNTLNLFGEYLTKEHIITCATITPEAVFEFIDRQSYILLETTLYKYIDILHRFLKWCGSESMCPISERDLSDMKLSLPYKRNELHVIDWNNIRSFLRRILYRTDDSLQWMDPLLYVRRRAIYLIMATTGLLPKDIAQLRKKDFRDERLFIKNKRLYIGPIVQSAIEAYLDERMSKHRHLFLDMNNTNPLTARGIQEIVASDKQYEKIAGLTPLGIRKFVIKQLIEATRGNKKCAKYFMGLPSFDDDMPHDPTDLAKKIHTQSLLRIKNGNEFYNPYYRTSDSDSDSSNDIGPMDIEGM